MSNTVMHAEKWTNFIASRAEFPHGNRLLDSFRAGEITHLCDCGCNSFSLVVPDGVAAPLSDAGSSGSVFELDFQTGEEQRTVSFCVFVDKRGYFAGMDVDYCANSFPMPEAPQLIEPPLNVVVSNAINV